MLAQLLPDASLYLHELTNAVLTMGKAAEGVEVFRIQMPRQRAAQVRDVESLESLGPPRHPAVRGTVDHGHAVARLGAPGMGQVSTASEVLQGDLGAVHAQPLVAAVLLVGEDGGGDRFLQTGGDGKPARTGADDDDIEHIVPLRLVWAFCRGVVGHCQEPSDSQVQPVAR